MRKTAVAFVLAATMFVLSTAMISAQDTEPKVVSADDSKWIVPDAEMIIKFNIKQLMSSQLMAKGGIDLLKQMIETNQEAKNVLKATGLDVTKDVDSILVSASGSSAKDVKALVVMRGKFDTTKLHDALKSAEGVKLTKDGATQLYEFEAQGQSMFAAFADKNTFVMTQSKEATVDALKNGGKKTAGMSKEMKKALSKFTGKESLSMAMVVNDDLKKMFEKAPRVGESASKLQTVTTSLTFTDSIAFNLNGITGEAKSAKQLGTGLDLLKAAGAAALAGMENLPDVVNDIIKAIAIDSNKEAVDVNLKISKEMIDKILKVVGGGAAGN